MPHIEIKDVTLKELLTKAAERSIHRVLLADYASVEPRRQSDSFVLAPMVKVVATAFDRDLSVIYRWWEQNDSEKMVSIISGTGKGPNPEGRLAARKEEVRQILREEGFEVDEGEWTPQSAEAFLDARQRAIG